MDVLPGWVRSLLPQGIEKSCVSKFRHLLFAAAALAATNSETRL